MRSLYKLFAFLMVLGFATVAWTRPDGPEPAPAAASHDEAAVERIFLQEAKLVENMRSYTPMVETYIQRLRRSEEHTSELQSHSDLVCRLLLEKKKKKKQQNNSDKDAQQ